MILIRRNPAFTLITILGLGLLSAPGYAADPCAAFKWDVAHERAVFAQTAETLSAAAAAERAPQLLPEHLYALSLQPQDQLRLPVAPGKKAQFADAFGGLMRLHVSAAGTYRVSLDQPGWIDVIGPAGVVASSDYAGAAGCKAPYKSVKFNLPSGDYLLQLSGVAAAGAQLAVTAAPN
jgi:hypothetical protein